MILVDGKCVNCKKYTSCWLWVKFVSLRDGFDYLVSLMEIRAENKCFEVEDGK